MQITMSHRNEAGVARLAFTVLFLLGFPAYAQVADRRLLLISIPDRQLALLQDGQVKKVYDVAVGKESTPSPTGSFREGARRGPSTDRACSRGSNRLKYSDVAPINRRVVSQC